MQNPDPGRVRISASFKKLIFSPPAVPAVKQVNNAISATMLKGLNFMFVAVFAFATTPSASCCFARSSVNVRYNP